jgi:hypothetical protein
MSFAMSASCATAAVRAPTGARTSRSPTAAAFAAPASAPHSRSAVRLSFKGSAAPGAAALRTSSTAARAAPRAVNLAVSAGRTPIERTYIMIKPDGVERGYVSAQQHCSALTLHCSFDGT